VLDTETSSVVKIYLKTPYDLGRPLAEEAEAREPSTIATGEQPSTLVQSRPS
jgi:hypothetical protein